MTGLTPGRLCRIYHTKSRPGAFAGRLCSFFNIESGDIAMRQNHIRRVIEHRPPHTVCFVIKQSFLWILLLLDCNTFVKSPYLIYIFCLEPHTLQSLNTKQRCTY
jgi:hypothetical protein